MKKIPQAIWLARLLVIAMGVGPAHPGCVSAAEPPPQVSQDGLELQPSKNGRVLYLKPGAKFDQYKRVAILDCYVEFDKNWQREYNNDRANPSHRVTTADMDRIKSALAAEFKKVFTEELQKNGGYQVVDTAAPDVLVLRPALVDLRITAPDLMTPDMSMTVVSSAGQMTLYLELWDSTSNTILARAMASSNERSYSRNQVASRVTNMAAADDILKFWAQTLRQRFDAVHAAAR